jgi:hypothetical protein
MPIIPPEIADIDRQIAIARQNLGDFIEQAATYAGAADDDLIAQRIADQEARLERLTKRRDEPQEANPCCETKRKRTAADGVHVGTVDRVSGNRIRLVTADSGLRRHKSHHHFIALGLVADIEGHALRLSANAATAVIFEEEASGGPT